MVEFAGTALRGILSPKTDALTGLKKGSLRGVRRDDWRALFATFWKHFQGVRLS